MRALSTETVILALIKAVSRECYEIAFASSVYEIREVYKLP